MRIQVQFKNGFEFELDEGSGVYLGPDDERAASLNWEQLTIDQLIELRRVQEQVKRVVEGFLESETAKEIKAMSDEYLKKVCGEGLDRKAA